MEANNKLALIDSNLNLDPILKVHKKKPWYYRNSLTIFSGPGYLRLKRVIDLVVSIFLVILVLPVLVFCAVAIRLDSPGPIVFVQKRTGLGGKRFKMLKLRTMRKDADEIKKKYMHLNLSLIHI